MIIFHLDLNSIFDDIGIDLDIINSNLSIASARFKNLLASTKAKLDAIKKTLKTERERQEDISILCNKYTDFSNVIMLSDVNTEGDAEYYNGAFMLPSKSYTEVKGEIVEVTGNGYTGNNYVYNNNEFSDSIKDTGNTAYMIDKSLMTYFEYSRITASNSEPEVFPLVNFDSIYGNR